MKPASGLKRSGSHNVSAVLRRLDIDPEEVEACPKVTDILARCFGKGKDLPRKAIFNYIAASDSACAVKFVRSMKGVRDSDLSALSFEAMCVRARVSPLELLGAILMAAKSMKATESALRAILAHPDVVQSTIDAATQGTPLLLDGQPVLDGRGRPVLTGHGDVKAQIVIHEAVGFLPTKKGGGVEINFGFGRPPEERGEDPDAEQVWDDVFPPLGSQIQEWSEQKHKLLEAETK